MADRGEHRLSEYEFERVARRAAELAIEDAARRAAETAKRLVITELEAEIGRRTIRAAVYICGALCSAVVVALRLKGLI